MIKPTCPCHRDRVPNVSEYDIVCLSRLSGQHETEHQQTKKRSGLRVLHVISSSELSPTAIKQVSTHLQNPFLPPIAASTLTLVMPGSSNPHTTLPKVSSD